MPPVSRRRRTRRPRPTGPRLPLGYTTSQTASHPPTTGLPGRPGRRGGRPVDSRARARHTVTPARPQSRAQLHGHRAPRGCAAPGADDCHRGRGRVGHAAEAEHDRRRVDVSRQRRGVLDAGCGGDPGVEGFQLLGHRAEVGAAGVRAPGRPHVLIGRPRLRSRPAPPLALSSADPGLQSCCTASGWTWAASQRGGVEPRPARTRQPPARPSGPPVPRQHGRASRREASASARARPARRRPAVSGVRGASSDGSRVVRATFGPGAGRGRWGALCPGRSLSTRWRRGRADRAGPGPRRSARCCC